MEKDLCISCHERPVQIKKRGLCLRCYQKFRKAEINKTGHFFDGSHQFCARTEAKKAHESEVLFVKHYFNHKNWMFRPGLFRINGESYSPDFYDGETNTFIEVTGTKQAYSKNKEKYKKFKELYPKINFEIRNPQGQIIDEQKSISGQIQ